MNLLNPKLFKKNIDIQLILTTFVLIFLGLVIIYDASVVSAHRDFGDKLYYFKNQLIWAAVGSVVLAFFALFDYHKLIRASPLLITFCIFLLILVLIPAIGTEVYGARRWINIFGFTFQPSEIIKLTFIFYATYILAKYEKYKIRLLDIAIVLFMPALIIAGLIIIQPDLGTALIFIGLVLTIYFIGGGSIWHFLMLIPTVAGIAVLGIITQPYRIARLKSYLDPFHDPQGASYQISQILAAIASGGFFGVGLGGSRSKFEFIPEVHSDAIFAVLVEETGFLGAIFLIGLFLLLITRAITIARNATDYQGKLLAASVASFLAIQSLFNLASMTALIPLTGVPLPFISYGGSSLLVTLASIGVLLNINRKNR